MTSPVTAEEQVIRDWLAGQLSPSGSPLPPSWRTSTPLPRRQVVAVVDTLVSLLDAARLTTRAVAQLNFTDDHQVCEEQLAEALAVIDSINGCHGCLDNGNDKDRKTVERLRAEIRRKP